MMSINEPLRYYYDNYVDYHCIISRISKIETINLMQNIDLIEQSKNNALFTKNNIHRKSIQHLQVKQLYLRIYFFKLKMLDGFPAKYCF